MDGISKKSSTARGFLLGQIAKNFLQANPIKLKDIFEEVYSVVYQAQKVIGGRILFLECLNNKKLKSLYENEGFKFLKVREEHISDNIPDEDKMIVMYKKLVFD